MLNWVFTHKNYVIMKKLTINTISDQVILFMHQKAFSEKYLSKELDISPDTASRRIKFNDWRFDEIRAIKRIFKRYDLSLVV